MPSVRPCRTGRKGQIRGPKSRLGRETSIEDQDETQSINEELTIDKQGILYDVSPFGLKPYPLNETFFTHEIIRFTADSLMIELSGTSDDLFVFNKLFLAGGVN